MAFKYKLPQRQSGLTPEKLQAMGAEVDLEARKEFVTTPANTDKSEELEKLIIYSLEETGFSPEDIDNYLEFLYIERNNNIGGEFGDVPLNEKISNIVKKVLTEEEKKKADRCLRIARRKFKKSSAYRSGAIVRCRQGKIWKDLKETDDPQSGKAAPYGSGYSKVKEIIENILKEDESLRKWFKRRGTPGKEGGWVDCNTCRNGKCKPCGRKKGEKRAKYPSCRPTPAQCKTRGKGKKWGKTK
jgi:hypothetical protein